MRPGGFVPDPRRLYDVGRDGRPYTVEPIPPDAAERLTVLIRRWWAASVLANAAAMGIAAGAAMLAPRLLAAWFGLLPIMTAPLLLVAPILRKRGARASRRVHRSRPGGFPPPDLTVQGAAAPPSAARGSERATRESR